MEVEQEQKTMPWTRETLERTFAFYQRQQARKAYQKRMLPNRESSLVPSNNTLVMIKYNDDDGVSGTIAENIDTTAYACMLNKNAYEKKRKAFMYPIEKIINITPEFFKVLLYIDKPNDTKLSTERFFDYIINLKALPMIVPTSPVVIAMSREHFMPLYASSSYSICSLKKLFALRANNCEKNIKTGQQLKVVNDQLLHDLEVVGSTYNKNLLDFSMRYHAIVENESSKSLDKTEKNRAVNSKMRLLFELCAQLIELMYDYHIDLINILECACINVYFHDASHDADMEHIATFDTSKKMVSYDWRQLTTQNCMKPYKGLSHSEKMLEFKKGAFLKPTSSNGFVFGEGWMENWEQMGDVQINYATSLSKEYMKIPEFRDIHEECYENEIYQRFSELHYTKKVREDDETNPSATPSSKIDILCGSAYACIQFLAAELAHNKLLDSKIASL